MPDDLLRPGHRFSEAWHLQTLAMAQALIKAGRISATDWAEALGAALAARPQDSEEDYYLAALDALEAVAPIDPADLAARKAAWVEAYRRTPHGQPVDLS